jgi:hypothetical protein
VKALDTAERDTPARAATAFDVTLRLLFKLYRPVLRPDLPVAF